MKATKKFFGIPAILVLALVMLSGCSSSTAGPRKALDATATAIEKKDVPRFEHHVWINFGVHTKVYNDENVMNLENGSMAAMCQDSNTHWACPWVPSALRTAKITRLNKSTAVALVTIRQKNWMATGQERDISVWTGLRKTHHYGWVIMSYAGTKKQALQLCQGDWWKSKKKEEAARAAKLKAEQVEYAKEVAAAKAKADKILDNVTFSGVKVSCSGNASQPVINVFASLTNHASYPVFPYKVAFEIVDRSGHTVAVYPMTWHRNKPIMPGEKAPLHGIFRASLLGTSPICKYYNELKWGGYSMKLSMAAIKRLDGSYVAQNGYPFVNKIPRPGTY